MFFLPQTPIFEPGTPLESFKMQFRSKWSEFEFQISDGGPSRENFYVFDTFLKRYFLEKSTKVRAQSFFRVDVWIFEKKRCPVLGSYKLFTSMNAHLCLFMSRDGQDDSPNMQEQEEK